MSGGITRRQALVTGAAFAASAPAFAQSAADYPTSQIKFVVSASAGGGNDLVARMVADPLSAQWKQPVIVENRPGAGNNIAAEYVYRSTPDCYTLLVSPPAPLVVNAALYKEIRFDPTKFVPVAITSYIPNVLVVNAKSPFKTAQEFIAYAKANPGKLSYSSQGNGTTGHLTGALFEQLTGAKQTHVPFGGAAPALNDVAAGHVDFMFVDIGTALPLAQGGLIRILATLSKDTIPVAPEVPTIASVGMPDFLSDTWTAFTAPPGTPADRCEKLSRALHDLILSPGIKDKLLRIGVIPWGLGPKESADVIARETKRWTDVVHAANVRLE